MEPFTPLPNWLITAIPDMPASVFQICVVIARQTFGYDNGNGGRREWDRISLTQFQKATGLSRQGVVDAIEKGENKWFKRRKSGQNLEYKLVNSVDQEEETSQLSVPALVNSVDQLGPKLVNSVDTQKKDLKKEERKEEKPPLPPASSLESDKSKQYAEIVRHYHADIGIITKTVGEAIQHAQDDFPAEWIIEAIQEAARYNKRSWAYAEKILNRWEREGRGPPVMANGASPPVTITRVEGDAYV